MSAPAGSGRVVGVTPAKQPVAAPLNVKTPADSKGPWDYYNLLAEVPGARRFRPLKDGGCPLVR
jgi:hypothetical protein